MAGGCLDDLRANTGHDHFRTRPPHPSAPKLAKWQQQSEVSGELLQVYECFISGLFSDAD